MREIGLNEMKHVYFKPWIGSRYIENSIKMLLLGESHYADETPSQEFTIDLTRKYSNGEFNHRFWTQIMQVVSGKSHWDIDRKEFWSNYAFYNYIQDVVAKSAGVGPSQEMVDAASTPFREVLAEHKPTHILVLSKRLWESLPDDGDSGESICIGNEKRETWIYSVSGHSSRATWIPHPSYGFSAPKWHPWILKFLEK